MSSYECFAIASENIKKGYIYAPRFKEGSIVLAICFRTAPYSKPELSSVFTVDNSVSASIEYCKALISSKDVQPGIPNTDLVRYLETDFVCMASTDYNEMGLDPRIPAWVFITDKWI